MKLAQLLNHRADLQKRMKDLRQRIGRNLLVQEGEQPIEQPDDLIDAFTKMSHQWREIVKVINAVNNQPLTDSSNGATISELVVMRDHLRMLHNMTSDAHSGLSPRMDRFSRSEIKQIPSIEAEKIRKSCDVYARDLRKLDDDIQELNWSTEVPDNLIEIIKKTGFNI